MPFHKKTEMTISKITMIISDMIVKATMTCAISIKQKNAKQR